MGIFCYPGHQTVNLLCQQLRVDLALFAAAQHQPHQAAGVKIQKRLEIGCRQAAGQLQAALDSITRILSNLQNDK